MKMHLFFLLYMLLLQSTGIAQHTVTVDSLKSIIHGISGKDKVKVLRDLCYHSSFINFEESIKYGEEAVLLATDIGFKEGLGASYEDLAATYLNAGQYETALDYSQKALTIFRETQNREREAFALHNLGIAYLKKGDYPTSLEYLLRALGIKNSLGGVKISSTLNVIGEVYRRKKDYDKALEFYFQALEEGQKNQNSDDISSALGNIEIIYRKQGDLVKALEFRTKAIELQKETEDNHGLAISYNNLGELYSAQDKLKKAIRYFHQSLAIKEQLNNRSGIAHTSEELALVYTKLGNFEMADAFAKKSMGISKAMGNRKKQLDVYLTLSQIYRTFGQHQQALLYHLDYSALKDSIFNEAKEVIISDMETKYQTNKKEAENTLLKLVTEQQIATIEQKNQVVTLFIIGLSILVILAGLLFRAYRQKIRNNKILVHQKEELAQLNATKNRFFGIIAHDLRGPLTALQGITGLLSYNIKKGDVVSLNKISQQIEESALNVNTLLDNLLKWALSQEGTIPYRPQRLALKSVIEESINYFRDMAATKGISLKANIPMELYVQADKETLSTVFRNLVNNCIKFTPHGGSVILSAVSKRKEVQIDVRDNGKGIEEEKLEKLFLLDNNKSTTGTANGLGLILVHDFVRMNHGTIQVQSKLNQGSVFSVMLPGQLEMTG